MPSTDFEHEKHILYVRETEAEAKRKRELHEVELAGEMVRAKHIELNLLQQREDLRPYRTHNTEVFFIPNGNLYVCRLTHFCLNDDEDEDESPREESIEATGDTPEEACTNFDHKWIHQEEEL